MSKQTTLQIGSLAVLALIGAALLWKLPAQVDRMPEEQDVVYADPYLDDVFDGATDDALAPHERVTQMYIEEGYPTATELSPGLRELMINLFTQTDAFVVIDEMWFGDSDERAVIASTLPSTEADPRVCGVDGQPLCILFYQNGDRGVEIYDIYQAFDESKESYYPYAPEILEILSMPHAGDVLVGGFIPFGMGKDFMAYNVVTEEGLFKLVDIQDFPEGLDVYSQELGLNFFVKVDLSQEANGLVAHVEISDERGELFKGDSQPFPNPSEGSLRDFAGFSIDAKSTYSQHRIYFSVLGNDYSYGVATNPNGKMIFTLDQVN